MVCQFLVDNNIDLEIIFMKESSYICIACPSLFIDEINHVPARQNHVFDIDIVERNDIKIYQTQISPFGLFSSYKRERKNLFFLHSSRLCNYLPITVGNNDLLS